MVLLPRQAHVLPAHVVRSRLGPTRWFYGQFPYVLVVLSNTPARQPQPVAAHAGRLLPHDPLLRVEAEVQIRLVTLADLTIHGSYAKVFLDPLARDPASRPGRQDPAVRRRLDRPVWY